MWLGQCALFAFAALALRVPLRRDCLLVQARGFGRFRTGPLPHGLPRNALAALACCDAATAIGRRVATGSGGAAGWVESMELFIGFGPLDPLPLVTAAYLFLWSRSVFRVAERRGLLDELALSGVAAQDILAPAFWRAARWVAVGAALKGLAFAYLHAGPAALAWGAPAFAARQGIGLVAVVSCAFCAFIHGHRSHEAVLAGLTMLALSQVLALPVGLFAALFPPVGFPVLWAVQSALMLGLAWIFYLSFRRVDPHLWRENAEVSGRVK